jgi:phage tail-like protein
MAIGERNDPYAVYNFIIEIDGIASAGFSECSGLTTDTDVIDYREGNEGLTVRKLPGLRKYSNIILKRGMTKDLSLWEWRKDVIAGKVERKAGSVVLLDEVGTEVHRWNFREAWPVKWDGSALNAKTNESFVETLELVHEGVEIVS